MSDVELARRLLDLQVEYVRRVEAELTGEWANVGTPTGRSRDEIAADYADTLRRLQDVDL